MHGPQQDSPAREEQDGPGRRLVRVRGRVQGVGFRLACAREAARLGIGGTVRNLWDGTVEADVEGPPEALEAMLRWLRTGPPTAQVDGLDQRRADPQGRQTFRVTD